MDPMHLTGLALSIPAIISLVLFFRNPEFRENAGASLINTNPPATSRVAA